jgi:hypothetical protein
MRLLSRIFPPRSRAEADAAYNRAVGASDDLIQRMRDSAPTTAAARAVMADVWAGHRNIPFLTTVYEAVQEMKIATINGSLSQRR